MTWPVNSFRAISRFDPGFYAGSRFRHSRRDGTIVLFIRCGHSQTVGT